MEVEVALSLHHEDDRYEPNSALKAVPACETRLR